MPRGKTLEPSFTPPTRYSHPNSTGVSMNARLVFSTLLTLGIVSAHILISIEKNDFRSAPMPRDSIRLRQSAQTHYIPPTVLTAHRKTQPAEESLPPARESDRSIKVNSRPMGDGPVKTGLDVLEAESFRRLKG